MLGKEPLDTKLLERLFVGAAIVLVSLMSLVLISVAFADAVPWEQTGLIVLVVLTLVVMLALGFGVWWFLVQPLRILEHTLKPFMPKTGFSLRERLLTGLTALIEDYQRSKLDLEESSENMRRAEKLALVGKLAAGVAHSIRNPLTGLKLRMFSLTRGLELSERKQEHVKAINESVAHMEKVISAFLDISRKPSLMKSDCNVSAVLDRVLLLLEPRLEAYRVRVERTRNSLPTIYADPEKLCEAFANLVSNACEAAGMDGWIRITEEYGHLDPLGKVIVIRIHDSGPGVPENLRDVIFDPFLSTKKEGTGLGLPIARTVFEEHGGWLNLHCLAGEGATFVCVLPIESGKEKLWLRST